MIPVSVVKIILLISLIALLIISILFIIGVKIVIEDAIGEFMKRYFPKYYYYNWEDEEL